MGAKKEFLERIRTIRFDSIDELYEKKDYIKLFYQNLDKEDKEFYKWYYYYELCMLKGNLKGTIWSFLNGKIDDFEVNRAYKDFCEQRDRMLHRHI